MSRFHIEPDGQYYAVYEGLEFRFNAPTLSKAHSEMKLWQGRVETEERLAAVERWQTAHEQATRRGGDGGKKKPRRPWALYALSIVNAASDSISNNVIVSRIRAEWKKHSDWPILPTSDRALQTWVSEVRQPQK
jgi:hypothetical protein